MFITSDQNPSTAANENARLRALEEYDIFDTPPNADLDRLVELAARMYGTPVAALSLVGRERLYFKSRFGMQATGIGRDGSFCAYAIAGDGLFLVPDASADPRFSSHPLVAQPPKIRFYAGIPLVAPSGMKIGTLCILDVKPWPTFTDDDRKNLEDVADLVMSRLELRRIEKAKQGGSLRFERIASTSPDAIFGGDGAGKINYWNDAAQAMFGYTAKEAAGKSIGCIFPERVRKLQCAEVLSVVNSAASASSAQQMMIEAMRRDGTEFTAELCLSTWRENDEAGFGAILRDVSEQGEQRLYGIAHLDPLTGLSNRSVLLERLKTASETETGTLLVLDLSGFKDVNDLLGHAAGDALLSETADRLRGIAGPDATVARIGADEFAIFLPRQGDTPAAATFAEEVLEQIAAPFAADGETVYLGANMGVAVCPAHGTGAEELLANAHLALQRSKTASVNGYQFFNQSLRRAAIVRRTFEAELKKGLSERQFELFYQPQVRLSDRGVVGAEALLRWRHPERGLLLPADFLSVLEASSSAAAVGEWVLKEACAQAAAWRRTGVSDFRIGVNLFAAQFSDGELPSHVERALIENQLPADALELEITENIMLRHEEAIIVPLREICAWGVDVAFDDYGTGYASLSLLKRFPVTRLKVDKSFVRDLCNDGEDAAIVQAIMYLGRRFGLGVIAEGIETEAQEETLRMFGCTEGQGYLYGRPMPASQLTDHLREDRERTVA
jgi:diguanylate cyclase (GGDEF)-like protein/PAS domain S-box-containing protein